MMENMQKMSNEDFCKVLQHCADVLNEDKRFFTAGIIEEAIRRLNIKPRNTFNDEEFNI